LQACLCPPEVASLKTSQRRCQDLALKPIGLQRRHSSLPVSAVPITASPGSARPTLAACGHPCRRLRVPAAHAGARGRGGGRRGVPFGTGTERQGGLREAPEHPRARGDEGEPLKHSLLVPRLQTLNPGRPCCAALLSLSYSARRRSQPGAPQLNMALKGGVRRRLPGMRHGSLCSTSVTLGSLWRCFFGWPVSAQREEGEAARAPAEAADGLRVARPAGSGLQVRQGLVPLCGAVCCVCS